ncbi:hypothetical protein NQZ68_017069, partial [Dissostichus eleginoides]
GRLGATYCVFGGRAINVQQTHSANCLRATVTAPEPGACECAGVLQVLRWGGAEEANQHDRGHLAGAE